MDDSSDTELNSVNETSNHDAEESTVSHKRAMEIFNDGMKEILQDPLLSDLPLDVTEEEINHQIALEYGQALTVKVRKQNGEVIPVVVLQGATVRDLRNAIKRHFTMKLEREGGNKFISWRYIWKTYWLCFEEEKLTEINKKIKDYGIRNRDEVTFVKRYRIQ
ncbi:U11/U12 small nuclear ribonucleoprotein 25 kDa protein-like [Saccoglossus kowalevskii]|uniref:U11/U12 small nuclear ribonucleoprotein 25 kDa protein-like n=1 Tax=Saccoglossus kowalevskii TaxID=10224 RepID=A0ABM0GKK9_SACKO|nr:PREDICTED: U11/U12 small nuclear ribonucleoprotein 25 kDa protein-like [Saccoglossus kowalevskii]